MAGQTDSMKTLPIPPLVTFLIGNVHYFMPSGNKSTHSLDNKDTI